MVRWACEQCRGPALKTEKMDGCPAPHFEFPKLTGQLEPAHPLPNTSHKTADGGVAKLKAQTACNAAARPGDQAELHTNTSLPLTDPCPIISCARRASLSGIRPATIGLIFPS